jgi:hypothetical protein
MSVGHHAMESSKHGARATISSGPDGVGERVAQLARVEPVTEICLPPTLADDLRNPVSGFGCRMPSRVVPIRCHVS